MVGCMAGLQLLRGQAKAFIMSLDVCHKHALQQGCTKTVWKRFGKIPTSCASPRRRIHPC